MNESILLKSIHQLPLSIELKKACLLNRLGNLSDLLNLHMNDILELPYFNHHLWNEYVAFLEQHGLGYHLN
ncbi:hypothetical protein FO440_22325 [Mucilaginibacter corticis]|uniref:Uncharacterized protein n=1 Tax=Mucilaginibacter corticis TaxID=2597670 RepID=A0A556M9H4_9SPHI|nr:hypothetical protein [Mucilaginibacter corticis]TSJ36567.1 hypothetical protein FO440_22325 [Mucilaginibacter corticis]